MHRCLVRHGFLAVGMFLLTCGAAAAQTISGVVTDTSGAVLPGVTVEATNAATQQVRSATTDDGGRYVIADLQPGQLCGGLYAGGFFPVNASRHHVDVRFHRDCRHAARGR